MFNALVVNKDEDGKTSSGVSQVTLEDLPDGEVVVAVEYSTVNWKDGLKDTINWYVDYLDKNKDLHESFYDNKKSN